MNFFHRPNRFISHIGLVGCLLLAMAAIGCNNDGPNNVVDGGDGHDGDGGNTGCVSASQCDDGNPCTDDSCQAGACVHTNNTKPCDDGQACSQDDHCQDGVCIGGQSSNCDDGNPCTTDGCSDASGCVHIANQAACDDGSTCTVGDMCANKSCQPGSALDCNDGNQCTDDSCDPASGCLHVNNTKPCDDQQACSSNDHCSNGVCVGDSNLECDDDNLCTEDSCDDTLGCVHSYNAAPCTDNDVCTENDVCIRGTCASGQRKDCNDNNACTTDSCDAVEGCKNVFNSNSCDDDNACTSNDQCQNGACVPGQAINCDDGNACTDDSCDTSLGCVRVYNAQPCNDQDACTMDDICNLGECHGVALDEDHDGYVPIACGGQDCDDTRSQVNPGSVEGQTATGTCTDQLDNDCDGYTDGNDTGCRNCSTDPECDDHDVCNGTDRCDNGMCVPVNPPLDCDDHNACTRDSCDAVNGCQNVVDDNLTCSDNNDCTTGDHCSNGTCAATTMTCDDQNACTDDSCVPGQGCSNVPNTASCNDNDACTENDRCSNTACTGDSTNCDDQNPCTDDTCDTATGCVHTPNGLGDSDQDGYIARECGGDDCNDNNANINPGAAEICGDTLDNNCNDLTDEGCPTCSAIDANAELIIDNNNPVTAYLLASGNMALNAFIVESSSYKVFAAKVAFWDFSGGSGNKQGQYSLRILADNNGLPGAEVGSSPVINVNNVVWPTLQTFTLTTPVGFTRGQIFWVAIRSEQDQSTNLFLPLTDSGMLSAYTGGVIYTTVQGTLDYYGTGTNFVIRVQGCGEGPRLGLVAHASNPAKVPAGQTATVTATLKNTGFANSQAVSGTISCQDYPEMVITTASSNFGVINQNAQATNNPVFQIHPDATAFGIYPILLESNDGPGQWAHGFGVYVQGTGCTAQNATLLTCNNTPTAVVNLAQNDRAGNYFVVQATSFSLQSVDIDFYRTANAPASANVRLQIYSYLAGKPDQLLFESSAVSVSGAAGIITKNYVVNPPLTFRYGNTFWVMAKMDSNLTLPSGELFGVLVDDGSGETNPPSWANGVMWDNSASAYGDVGAACVIGVNGCQATELRYASHTTSPANINPGATANITVTLANDGAVNATNVSATLASNDSDITVTDGNAAFGTVPANGTKVANDAFVVQVAGNADAFQYLLPLTITDTVNTWYGEVPLRLAGGNVDLNFGAFTATLAGSDLQYHFVVQNTGNVDCINPFQVDLYLTLDTPPQPGQSSTNWNQVINTLPAGQSQTFDLVLQNAAMGTYHSYVQVDTLGAVSESNESNNVSGPQTVTIGNDAFVLLSPHRKWFPADMPVSYRFASGTQPEMPSGQDKVAVHNGFLPWQDVTPATITFTESSQTGPSGFVYDGLNTMTFNDPTGELSTGVLAATIPYYDGGESMVTNGVTFYRMVDSDIVFNNNVGFGTHQTASSCNPYSNPLMDMEGVAAHEIGHLIGLDHAEQFDATMYYAVDYCDGSKTSLAASDINGTNFIYP